MSKYTINQAKHVVGTTNWKKVKELTDQEIRKAAISDWDSKPLSANELTQFKPLRLIKTKLGL